MAAGDPPQCRQCGCFQMPGCHCACQETERRLREELSECRQLLAALEVDLPGRIAELLQMAELAWALKDIVLVAETGISPEGYSIEELGKYVFDRVATVGNLLKVEERPDPDLIWLLWLEGLGADVKLSFGYGNTLWYSQRRGTWLTAGDTERSRREAAEYIHDSIRHAGRQN